MDRKEVERLAREFLVEYFSDEELNTLCADLGIDYDCIGGEGKASRARELVEYCARRNILMSLLELAKDRRPKVPLPAKLAQLLRESTSSTQEVMPSAILEKIRQTGGLNISMKALMEFGDRVTQVEVSQRTALIFSIISIIMSLLTMLLVALK